MDSDDEDELLQMALQEQEQSKPSNQPKHQNSKPAAPESNKNTKGSGRQHKSVDLDDDSDVEMLSISSDEEISTAKKKPVGRDAKGDSRPWQGGEPNCWKHVDETELSRRVREMRESRAAPVVPKIERKKSIAGKGLHTLQSFPRGMECIDPLGVGIIDNKTLRLITDNADSSPAQNEKDLEDPNLREKLMYLSDKFDPKLFLSRIHRDTPGTELEAGCQDLRTDLKGRTQQKKQLVKENFDCFVSCKTTIDDIESKLKRIEEDPEGSGTINLLNIIQKVSGQANLAFGPLFERQAQAEKIRSVQGMLQRFRTLFNLPSTIRGSISKGEYDLAVREYRKAQSIVLPSHVKILKRVLEEVDKVMQEFKAMLYKSMEDPLMDLTTLETTVRLLLELEPDSDPVWHYLNIQNRRTRGFLEKCTVDHEARLENLQNELQEKAISDARWKQIQHDLNEYSDADNSQPIDCTGTEADVLRGRYIRWLTTVLIHHIPAFWKVALSVCNDKFGKSSQVSADANGSTQEERSGDGKYAGHSLEEVALMIRNTITAYESKVHETFEELEESNILQSYMSDAIEEISKACQAFEAKEAAPQIAVAGLRDLQSDITKIYILRLCSWMRVSMEEISKQETWVPISTLERNRSPYAISSLPLVFESVLSSAMEQINSMIHSLKNEAAKSEDAFVQLQEIQESVRLAFLNCLLDFAGHLENIGGTLGQHRATKNSHLGNRYSYESQDNISDSAPLPGSISNPEGQLLMVLSNIGFCKDELSRDLHHKYQHIWLQTRGGEDDDSDIQDLVMSFSGLQEKVLEQYTFLKANSIRTSARNYLLDSGFQWGSAPTVKGVRDVAVELLHTLVAVHAEVFAGCKPLMEKTLGVLMEGLIDTFISIFDESKTTDFRSLNANGFCQLMLELEYFENILNPYCTNDARESLKSLQGLILEKAIESVPDSAESPSHHRKPTRGSEDALSDHWQQLSPDDLIALAKQYSSELLHGELERTRINTACFTPESAPERVKASSTSSRGQTDPPSRSSRSSQQAVGSRGDSRQRRR